MFNILFINACILIAIISIVFQVYHNQKKYFINHTLLSKIILGIGSNNSYNNPDHFSFDTDYCLFFDLFLLQRIKTSLDITIFI